MSSFERLQETEQAQLFFLQVLKGYRTPFGDFIASIFNFVDTTPFFFLLVPFIWVMYKRYWGISFLYLFLLSSFVNSSLKNFFMIPRPYIQDPGIELINVGNSFSFPSGAAQTALLLSALLIWARPKSLLAWIVGVNFFIWHSFSRLYLGVHYPLDIFVGWAVGAVLVLCFIFLFPKIAEVANKHLLSLFLFQALLLIFTVGYFNDSSLIRGLACSTGICFGLLFSPQETYIANWKQKCIKYAFIFLGVFVGMFLFSNQLFAFTKNSLSYVFMGIWLTLLHESLLKKFPKIS